MQILAEYPYIARSTR